MIELLYAAFWFVAISAGLGVTGLLILRAILEDYEPPTIPAHEPQCTVRNVHSTSETIH